MRRKEEARAGRQRAKTKRTTKVYHSSTSTSTEFRQKLAGCIDQLHGKDLHDRDVILLALGQILLKNLFSWEVAYAS